MASGLDFRASSVSGGKLTTEEYASRRDECTKEELARLMDSKEFKEWDAARKQGGGACRSISPSRRTQIILATLGIVLAMGIAVLVFAQRSGALSNVLPSRLSSWTKPLGLVVQEDITQQQQHISVTPPTVPSSSGLSTTPSPPDAHPEGTKSRKQQKEAALVRALHQEVKSLREAAALSEQEHEQALAALKLELDASGQLLRQLDSQASSLRMVLATAAEDHKRDLELQVARCEENEKEQDGAAAVFDSGDENAVYCRVPALLEPLVEQWPWVVSGGDKMMSTGFSMGPALPLSMVIAGVALVGLFCGVLGSTIGFKYGKRSASGVTGTEYTVIGPSNSDGLIPDAAPKEHVSSTEHQLLLNSSNDTHDDELLTLREEAKRTKDLIDDLGCQLAAQEEALIASQSTLAAEESRAQRAAATARAESANLASQVEDLRRQLDAWRCAAGELAAEIEAATSATYEAGLVGTENDGREVSVSQLRTPLSARGHNTIDGSSSVSTPAAKIAGTMGTPSRGHNSTPNNATIPPSIVAAAATPGPTPGTTRFRSWLAASPAPAAPGPADEYPAPWLASSAARVSQLRERVLGLARRAGEAVSEARSRKTDADWHSARVRELATDLELVREQLLEERRARGIAESRAARVRELEREVGCLEAQIEQLTLGLEHARAQKAEQDRSLSSAEAARRDAELLLQAADGERVRLESALRAARTEVSDLVAAGARLVHAERAIGVGLRELEKDDDDDKNGLDEHPEDEYEEEDQHQAINDEQPDLDRSAAESLTPGHHNSSKHPMGETSSLSAVKKTPNTARSTADLEKDLRRAVEEKVRALELLASAEKRMLEARALFDDDEEEDEDDHQRSTQTPILQQQLFTPRHDLLNSCPPTVPVTVLQAAGRKNNLVGDISGVKTGRSGAYSGTPSNTMIPGRRHHSNRLGSHSSPAASTTTTTTSTLRSAGGFVGRVASKLARGAAALGGALTSEVGRDSTSPVGELPISSTPGSVVAQPFLAASTPNHASSSPLPTPEALASWLERTQALFGDADEALGAEIHGLDVLQGGVEERNDAETDGKEGEERARIEREEQSCGILTEAASNATHSSAALEEKKYTSGAVPSLNDGHADPTPSNPVITTSSVVLASGLEATSAAALCAALRETGQEVDVLLERLRSLSCGAGEEAAHDLTRAYSAARSAAAELADASQQAWAAAEGSKHQSRMSDEKMTTKNGDNSVLEDNDAEVKAARAALESALKRKSEADTLVDKASEEVCAAHRAFDHLMAAKLADTVGESPSSENQARALDQASISADAFEREAGRRSAAQKALNEALASKRDALDAVSKAARRLEAAETAAAARAGSRADAQEDLAAAATRRAAAAARLHAAQNDLAEAVGVALDALTHKAADPQQCSQDDTNETVIGTASGDTKSQENEFSFATMPCVLREDSWW